MRDVSPGDVVFSFCDTRIKPIGVVTGGAQTGPKPDFGAAGSNWSREGWFVPVDYCVLNNPIRPKDHAAILRPFLPAKYSPLQESGDGLQSVYLAEVPQALADALIGLIGQAYWDPYATIACSTAGRVAQCIRPTETGANVMLLAPFDDVVFERTWKDGGLTFVAASQAAVDLLTSPGRAPSEAEAILEQLAGNAT